MTAVTLPWTHSLTMMQQSVLLSAIRGPDGIRKHHPCKSLIRWFRRCVLYSAFDGVELPTPYDSGGGSFTGRSIAPVDAHWTVAMIPVVDDFLTARDELPFHYFTHFMHAAEVIGYKHPDKCIREFWKYVYERMVNALHLFPESEDQMDRRLGDDISLWQERSDEASVCSD